MDAYLTDILVELGQVHPHLGEDMVEVRNIWFCQIFQRLVRPCHKLMAYEELILSNIRMS
jgi:hypothetical protein